MQDLKIALLQCVLQSGSPQQNYRHLEELMKQQRVQNDLVLLPETFGTGFSADTEHFAEEREGPGMAWMQRMAQTYQTVVCGSLLLKQGKTYSNTLVWMRPDGSYETYAKRHVFRMGGEHEYITPGNTLQTVELKGWKVRPLICYDLRFPAWCRNSYSEGVYEYDLLLFVANWPAQRSWPWKQLLIARAIENISCVAGLNRVGNDEQGNSYTGDSVVLDARGIAVANATPGEETVLEARLSAAQLLDFRQKFKVALDWDRFNILHLSEGK